MDTSFCVKWLSAVINCEREQEASLTCFKTRVCFFSPTAEISSLVKRQSPLRSNALSIFFS